MTVEEKSVSVVEFAPQVQLANAKSAATQLANVIKAKPKKVIINNEQYLEFEDWQLLGQFFGYSVRTRDATFVEVNDVNGAHAAADLIDTRTGIVVGGAEAYCMQDEANWHNKPWFQLASMAQTRAGAKAFRNKLSLVAAMAGFSVTPAEEMAGEKARPIKQKDDQMKALSRLFAVAQEHGYSVDEVKEYAHKKYDVQSSRDLSVKQIGELTDKMLKHEALIVELE